VIRQPIIADANGNPQVITDRNSVIDDALGGRYYYLGHLELEIPLGSGARELGLRPSIFLDAGAVWGIKTPQLQSSPFPNGIFIPTRDSTGAALYQQINVATLVNGVCTAGTGAGDVTNVTNPVNPSPPSCLASASNTALGSSVGPFQEVFLGNSPKPRISVGIGVNWNSPFGPFRIDFAHVLLKRPGDDTKSFTFNVGTQF
jgi:outer membrane protein insertion porin family